MHTALNLDTDVFTSVKEQCSGFCVKMETIYLYDNTSAISRGVFQEDLRARHVHTAWGPDAIEVMTT
jgi:hypothetical protein